MTLTIRRPASGQRVAVVAGLAAILVLATFAFAQNRTVDPTTTRTVNVAAGAAASQSAAYWEHFQSIQDGFLVPTITAPQDTYWAHLALAQDGFLPPAVGFSLDPYWAKLQSLQDGFLPPTAVDASGPEDTRVSQPR